LFDEALHVSASIQQLPIEFCRRKLPLDFRPPMAVGNAGVVGGFLDGEVVFAG
jgi:hypothetical protein